MIGDRPALTRSAREASTSRATTSLCWARMAALDRPTYPRPTTVIFTAIPSRRSRSARFGHQPSPEFGLVCARDEVPRPLPTPPLVDADRGRDARRRRAGARDDDDV